MSQLTLRISTHQTTASIAINLEGRIAGPWADELSRVWLESAPTLGRRKLLIDLRNTTYADESGIRVLREIYSETAAEIVTSTPWTKYLAEEITRGSAIVTTSDPIAVSIEEL
jgi:anti-anti-sigma regulatory factor